MSGPRDAGESRLGPAYVQARWVRTYRPGPWRVVLLLALLAAGAFAALAALVAAVNAPSAAVAALAAGAGLGLLLALGALVVRVFRVGVWVDDAGVREVRLTRTRSWPWPQVHAVTVVESSVPLLGSPLRRLGRRVRLTVTVQDGARVPYDTVVHSASPDLLGRPEAFDVASAAIENWHRRT